MFKSLAGKFSNSIRSLMGKGKITQSSINDAVKSIRSALIDADVSLSVVDNFIKHVETKALGEESIAGISHADQFTKIIHDELVATLSHPQKELKISKNKPMTIALAGLQGAGKTTSIVKLALWLGQHKQLKIAVASIDCHRPAAVDQLRVLCEDQPIDFIDTQNHCDSAEQMADYAITTGRKTHADIILLDFAGRHQIDQALMNEAQSVVKKHQIDQVLFTVDSMLGQAAADLAKAFHDALPLSGIILTKLDAESRGGAALSARQVTGLPILFVGNGEKLEDFDTFSAERIAGRLLDMGDIVSLVKEAERHIDKKQAKKTAGKMRSGQFDFDDFLSQLQQIKKMGGMMSILDRLPGMASLPDKVKDMVDETEFKRTEAAIQSMTKRERAYPDLVKQPSRMNRIAKGCGQDIKVVKQMLKKFDKMTKMMKKFSGAKMSKMMGQMFSGNMDQN